MFKFIGMSRPLLIISGLKVAEVDMRRNSSKIFLYDFFLKDPSNVPTKPNGFQGLVSFLCGDEDEFHSQDKGLTMILLASIGI